LDTSFLRTGCMIHSIKYNRTVIQLCDHIWLTKIMVNPNPLLYHFRRQLYTFQFLFANQSKWIILERNRTHFIFSSIKCTIIILIVILIVIVIVIVILIVIVIVIVIVKYDSYKTQIQNNIKMVIIIIIDYRWLYSLKFI